MSDAKRYDGVQALREDGGLYVLASDYDALAARLSQAERLLRQAVTPHQFNCGTVKDTESMKMRPVDYCTCGLDAFLAALETKSC